MKTVHRKPIIKAAQQVIDKLLKDIEAGHPLNAKQIHRLRVATKKLRALLQLYRPLLPRATIAAVDSQVKQIADLYAASRDAHVLRATLLQLENRDAITPLLDHLSTQAAGSERAAPDIDLPATSGDILQCWQQQLAGTKDAGFLPGIEYSYARARKLARKASASKDDAQYHACRKWLKYYFYQLGLSDLKKCKGLKQRKRLKNHRRRAGELAERLGTLHDLSVLATSLERLLQTTDGADTDLNAACELALQQCRDGIRRDKQFCDRQLKRFFARKRSPALS